MGTDGSVIAAQEIEQSMSRPYGDGWFSDSHKQEVDGLVPSLWGRMVLFQKETKCVKKCPVPMGTDGS